MPDFTDFSIAVNLAIFGTAGVFVWLAGTRLAGYADVIGPRTGLSDAFLGMVMLGVATSLPEVATTIGGAVANNPQLVTGNLFGGVAMQVAVLAIADLVAVRGALTYFTPQPVLLAQGVLLVLLLSIAMAGASAGEPIALWGVGLTPVLLLGGYILTLRLTQGRGYLPRWQATHVPELDEPGNITEEGDREQQMSNARLYASAAVAAAIILAAGWALAMTGDALAGQTGLGASFVGVALVAASTSLPELSTTLGAIRQRNHEMAVSNILGTNCLEVALFFVADLAYRGGPILASADRSAFLAGSTGLVVTCVLLLGLLERRNRTVLGMGVDSLAILVVYATGLTGLYYIR